MRWSEILSQTATLDHVGDTEISGVHYDSRRVLPGDLFVAMRGGSTDGNRFIASALSKGATAILTDSPEVFAQLRAEGHPVALVSHGRRALAEASAAFFGHPESRLKVSAVTGTNGKTTTAFLLEQMLSSAGRKCLLIGTIETRIAGKIIPSEHTTPEARDLYALFAEAVEAGCTEVVMEMSSHALEQERVWGIPVDVAIFTNLTQDHLDYHGTMDAYASAKLKLFQGVGAPPPRVSITNQDDPLGNSFWEKSLAEIRWSYGVCERGDCAADLCASSLELRPDGTRFTLRAPGGERTLASPLVGRVNIYNLLAALGAAIARGLTPAEASEAVKLLKQVPGRFEVVRGSAASGFTVAVDYAHTDDALTNLLSLARNLVGPHGGRVITLFGCGGDRDRTKRPKMGRAAGAASDLVVLTSDNPRSEDPMDIINEVLPGVRETHTTFIVEPDRRAAIEIALRAAKPGDIVLLAGKGHEKEQIFADGPVPFDDVAEAERILDTMQQEKNA